MITKGKWECGKAAGIWCDEVKILSTQYPLSKDTPFEICEEAAQANARLIVTACNACQEINPDNPQAAADALVAMYEACKAFLDDFICPAVPEEIYKPHEKAAINKARQALSKAEGKE